MALHLLQSMQAQGIKVNFNERQGRRDPKATPELRDHQSHKYRQDHQSHTKRKEKRPRLNCHRNPLPLGANRSGLFPLRRHP